MADTTGPAENAGEVLDRIGEELDRTGAAWVAAGYPSSGPEFEAREAAFGRLRAWNEGRVAWRVPEPMCDTVMEWEALRRRARTRWGAVVIDGDDVRRCGCPYAEHDAWCPGAPQPPQTGDGDIDYGARAGQPWTL